MNQNKKFKIYKIQIFLLKNKAHKIVKSFILTIKIKIYFNHKI